MWLSLYYRNEYQSPSCTWHPYVPIVRGNTHPPQKHPCPKPTVPYHHARRPSSKKHRHHSSPRTHHYVRPSSLNIRTNLDISGWINIPDTQLPLLPNRPKNTIQSENHHTLRQK